MIISEQLIGKQLKGSSHSQIWGTIPEGLRQQRKLQWSFHRLSPVRGMYQILNMLLSSFDPSDFLRWLQSTYPLWKLHILCNIVWAYFVGFLVRNVLKCSQNMIFQYYSTWKQIEITPHSKKLHVFLHRYYRSVKNILLGNGHRGHKRQNAYSSIFWTKVAEAEYIVAPSVLHMIKQGVGVFHGNPDKGSNQDNAFLYDLY